MIDHRETCKVLDTGRCTCPQPEKQPQPEPEHHHHLQLDARYGWRCTLPNCPARGNG